MTTNEPRTEYRRVASVILPVRVLDGKVIGLANKPFRQDQFDALVAELKLAERWKPMPSIGRIA